jgi:ketosteroid isomerase-like protein
MTTYACAVDDRDWETFQSVFTDDAVLDYTAFGGPRGSAEEVAGWTAKALTVIEASQHFITNVRVRLEGDEATAESYVFSPLALAGGGIMHTGGSYSDRLRRTADGWRIANRVASLTWSDRPVRSPKP